MNEDCGKAEPRQEGAVDHQLIAIHDAAGASSILVPGSSSFDSIGLTMTAKLSVHPKTCWIVGITCDSILAG